MLAKQLQGAALATQPVFIEDTFSSYLYTGNNATNTITNGIDLSTYGGLVWCKNRSSGNHSLWDTARGAKNLLIPNDIAANLNIPVAYPAYPDYGLQTFNSNGFTLGKNWEGENIASGNMVSWTMRKQSKFLDIVTYTGNGSNRTISHNLGSVPGCIIIKRTDTTGAWQVYHRANTANPETDYLVLNTTAATADSDTRWNDTLPTSTVFSLGTDATVNANTGTYVAYLFAHDAGGFGASGTDNVISCGSFTSNASGNITAPVNLGWEPQWVLWKVSSGGTSNWWISDNMRGLSNGDATNGSDSWLYPNLTNAESGLTNGLFLLSNGFSVRNGFLDANRTYIYIAIRRGPMRTPTSGTSVYGTTLRTVNSATFTVANSFPLDLLMLGIRNNAYGKHITHDRLRDANQYLSSSSTAAEASASAASVTVNFTNAQTGVSITDNNGSWGGNGGSAGDTGNLAVYHFFRRAPGFFDVVCYTGNGVGGRTISHNLGAIPQLMIFKSRSSVTNWAVGGAVFPDSTGDYLTLNAVDALNNSSIWNYTSPTSTTLTVGNASQVNTNAATYVAYLFATVTGVSKVFSFTGNGSSQTINCGFTAGARFVMIKRTDSTGDWYIWDSSRGIVSGNDPHLSLNTTAAEVTTDDTIDPDNSGFIVNQVTATNVNVNNATYIGLAIA